MRINKSTSWIILVVIALVVAALMTFGNYQYAAKNPGGADFLVHWMGTRTFLTTGTSPYSDATAVKSQTIAYGRPAQAGENQLRVAYPLFSVFFFAPFALIADFIFARALWMTALELCLIAIVLLGLRLTFWRPKPLLLGALLFFTLISYNAVRPLIDGNAVIVVALLLVISLLCIRDGKDEIAGVLLAFSTIKPQSVILLIAFIFFWALFNKRYRILGYFLGTMVILVGFSTLLIPDWISQNFKEILRYSSSNPPGTVAAVLNSRWGAVGTRLGLALTALLAILLLFEWWRGRYAGGRYFLWLAFFTLTVSQWIGIQTAPENFILLYPAIFFSLEMISGRWKEKANGFIILFIGLLTAGVWLLALATMQKSYLPIQNLVLFFPIPFVVFVLLYWVRWWVTHSRKVDYDSHLLEI